MVTRIAVDNSGWGNIGNAFFGNATIADLRLAYGERVVVDDSEELPIHALSKWGGRKESFLDYSLLIEADWYVGQGPMFHPSMASRLEKLFSSLKASNTKIVFIGAGSNQYDEEEIAVCREFLKKYPLYVLSTRDTQTYRSYADLAEYSYDGVCPAFFSSLHYPGYDTPRLGRYITYGFEMSTEPIVEIGTGTSNSSELLNRISVDCGSVRRLSPVGLLLDNFKKYPDRIGELLIIRLLHKPLAKFSLFAYNRPNKFVSVNPYTYLNLYRNTELTLSQRVHACAATLSYQKPAMLCKKTKRAALFERLGLGDITDKPVWLSREILLHEHQSFIEFLKGIPL